MTDFDQTAFGKVLFQLRKQKRLSQETLSGLAGISRGCYRMLELGRSQPSLKIFWSLADVLGIPPTELMEMVQKKAEEQALN